MSAKTRSKPKKRKSPLKRARIWLDKRLDSPVLLNWVADRAAQRIQRAHAAIQWELDGFDALKAEVSDRVAAGNNSSHIMAFWHERLMMSPYMWDTSWGPALSIRSSARPGRVVAEVMERFDIQNVAMHDRKSNRAVSIQVARQMRQGLTAGIACDGPLGPARQMKTVPLDWARLTGAPIWLWTYSVTDFRVLNAWDRMLWPRKRGRGLMVWRRWDVAVPRKLTPEAMEDLRSRLEADLTALCDATDARLGIPPRGARLG